MEDTEKKTVLPFQKTQNPIATTKLQFLNPLKLWRSTTTLGCRVTNQPVTSLHCQVSALTIRGKVQTTHRVGKATQPPS